MRKLSLTVDGRNVSVFLHKGDLPADYAPQGAVAVDCEMMGLSILRDRLCLVQLWDGVGDVHLVQFAKGSFAAPRLKALLTDPGIEKIFHYARTDVTVIRRDLGVITAPLYCTKIASRLARTYTDRHGLKDLVKELTGKELSKDQQSSDWGADDIADAQLVYAAHDVLHLHACRVKLDAMLEREGRAALAQACFDFLPHRAELDLLGWETQDIFAHS